ncbi:MAG: hypothetical protein WC761_01345 [Candidatus Paceibacterota bacterium]|jgi:hypothetical protein
MKQNSSKQGVVSYSKLFKPGNILRVTAPVKLLCSWDATGKGYSSVEDVWKDPITEGCFVDNETDTYVMVLKAGRFSTNWSGTKCDWWSNGKPPKPAKVYRYSTHSYIKLLHEAKIYYLFDVLNSGKTFSLANI